jgi:hypothetical protein
MDLNLGCREKFNGFELLSSITHVAECNTHPCQHLFLDGGSSLVNYLFGLIGASPIRARIGIRGLILSCWIIKSFGMVRASLAGQNC